MLTVGEGVWYYNKAVRAGETAGRARTLKIEQHFVFEETKPLRFFEVLEKTLQLCFCAGTDSQKISESQTRPYWTEILGRPEGSFKIPFH